MIIVLTIISTTLYSSLISDQIKKIAIERAEESNAAYLTSLAKNELIKQNFESQNFDEKNSVFTDFFQHLKSKEIFRIKVWSQDGTVIYSDDESIVGKKFQDNSRFQDSIKGQITSEIKDPIDPENIAEMGYGQLIEIYVPIWLDSPEPVGVIELYCSLDSVNESINQVNFLVFQITIILIAIISFGVFIFTINMARISKRTLQNEKFATIGQLSARVAHDLRNPLSVIKNIITLDELNPPKTNEETNKRKKMLSSAVDRMTHQINGVMNMIKTSPLEIKNISIKTIMESSQDSLIIPKDIQIKIEGSETTFPGDPKLLESVFSNLISNSIHAMNGKGIIRVKQIEEKNQIIIKVIDDGPGIPKKDLSKIFTPLFTTKQRGTGLGLFSCKGIVEQHGGTIEVSNNPTTFTIKLPKTDLINKKDENE